MMLNPIQKINLFFPFIFSLLLFAGGCIKQDPWQNLTIKTGHREHNTSKLIQPSKASEELSLEFIICEEKLIAYLYLEQNTIDPYQDQEQLAQVEVRTKKNRYQFLAYRLLGAQKIKIPDDILEPFLNALSESSECILSINGRYKTPIRYHHLESKIKKLKKENNSVNLRHTIFFSL